MNCRAGSTMPLLQFPFACLMLHIVTASLSNLLTGATVEYISLTSRGIVPRHSAAKWIAFNVKACSKARIALTNMDGHYSGKVYEIVFEGGENPLCIIRTKVSNDPEVVVKRHEGSVLSCSEFVELYVSWYDGDVTIGRGHTPFMNKITSWLDPEPLIVNYVAVSTGYGYLGEWKFPQSACGYLNLKASYRTQPSFLYVKMNSSVVMQVQAESMGKCAILCVKNYDCDSFTFNSQSLMCRGHGAAFSSKTEGQGETSATTTYYFRH